VLALVVAGGGLGIADRWRSELLAGGVTVGAAVLAPVLAHDWMLVALVLALQLAALLVVLRRHWVVLMLVAAAGPLLYGVIVVAVEGFDGPDVVTVVALGLATLAVSLGTAVPAARLLPAPAVGAVIAAAPVVALVAAAVLDGWSGAALAAGVALVMAAAAALPLMDRAHRVVAATAGVVALFVATVLALHGATLTVVVLGEAIVAAVLAGALRSRFALVVGMVVGGLGVLAALGRDAPLEALVRFPAYPYLLEGVAQPGALVIGAVVSAMALALAGVLLVSGGRIGWIRPDARTAGFWAVLGLIGLYGAAGLVLAVALSISPDRAGFTAGHALVTVSWTVAALVLLARGISRPALRIAGLVLVAAAVAKLVLFDLVALDGLARVGAFLGAGLVLLAAGTRYARLVAEAETSPSDGAPRAEQDATGPNLPSSPPQG
jgi:hypothetical protein